MSVEVTPEMRREIIEATGLCIHPDCRAHDDVVARIWEYKYGSEGMLPDCEPVAQESPAKTRCTG